MLRDSLGHYVGESICQSVRWSRVCFLLSFTSGQIASALFFKYNSLSFAYSLAMPYVTRSSMSRSPGDVTFIEKDDFLPGLLPTELRRHSVEICFNTEEYVTIMNLKLSFFFCMIYSHYYPQRRIEKS